MPTLMARGLSPELVTLVAISLSYLAGLSVTQYRDNLAAGQTISAAIMWLAWAVEGRRA